MNRPLPDALAWTIAVLLSGLTAGMFLMDLLGYYPLLTELPHRAAIELHQHAVPGRRLVFRLAIGSSGVMSPVLVAFFSGGVSRRLILANLVCLIALVVCTNAAVVPLSREIATWQPDAPPPGWQSVFSRMVLLERLRSLLPLLAFALELVAFVSRGGPRR